MLIGPILRPFGLAALAMATALPATAEDMTLGNVHFEAPEGWERQEDVEGIMLVREFAETEDTEQGAAMIQILEVKGTQNQLDANIAEVVSWIDGMSEEDPMVDSAGTTLNGHRIKVEFRCCTYTNDVSMSQTVAGIASESEQVLASLIFVNTSSDHEEAADLAFEALVRSIRFEGDSDTGMAPEPGDGGLDGVFTHLSTGLMPNAFGGLDFTSESEIMVFDPAGLFSEAIPVGGDIAAHCAATPTDCGTYKVSGGGWFGGARTIEMRSMVDNYGVIETEVLPLEKSGEDLSIDEGDYYRIPPFADGHRFDGTWSYTWALSGMTATSSGSIAVERTLVLDKDGTYSRSGWSGGSTSGDMGGVTVSSKRPGSAGTYEVAGYELILTGNDGTTETLSLFAPDKGSDELLVIDGSNYLKED